MSDSEKPNTILVFAQREGGSDNWMDDAALLMVECMAAERGGQLTLTREKATQMLEKLGRWYPHGFHLHAEWTPEHLRMNIENALTCTHQHDDRGDDQGHNHVVKDIVQ